VSEELRATYKVLIGFVALCLWIAAAGFVIGWLFSPLAGLASLVAMPFWASATLILADRWQDTFTVARRFLQLQRGGKLRERLCKRQRELAHRLAALLNQLSKPVPEHR
jgi:predicted RND superfamily exporter protein